MGTLTLPERISKAIEREALAAYPHECCGVLLGHVVDGQRQVIRVEPAQNVAFGRLRRRTYRLQPLQLLQLERLAERDGLSVLGFYHSHPDAPAQPSGEDARYAWPLYSYLIVSVMGGGVLDLTSWQFNAEAGRFEEECLLDESLQSATIQD